MIEQEFIETDNDYNRVWLIEYYDIEPVSWVAELKTSFLAVGKDKENWIDRTMDPREPK